ncbi:CBK_G0011260.mRNA.1.CDS.1 [Saccharomyces cerevisiae]|nr:CBK_G0011260.mRNA.1.CDS.1 [Saccharomyces cerevisiae]CAI7213696.1 CBK_G0011260.mRNA.1.CDS.1 [Saccharomyces cerevisiae]
MILQTLRHNPRITRRKLIEGCNENYPDNIINYFEDLPQRSRIKSTFLEGDTSRCSHQDLEPNTVNPVGKI